jgi:hypothetical protein
MQKLIAIFFENILRIWAIGYEGPTLIAVGRPADISPPAYLEAIQNQAGPKFKCNHCRAEVASVVIKGVNSQLCRCMAVQHPGGGLYQDTEAWENFRKTYERESHDPAPDDLISGTPTLSRESREYIARKLGQDRGLIKTSGGGSVYSDPDFSKGQGMISTLIGPETRDEDLDDLVLAYRMKTGPIPPPVTVFVTGGLEFPSAVTRTEPLPFKCPECKTRVQEGRAEGSYIDRIRILLCECMAIMVRRDVASPRCAKDWQGYRDTWAKGQIHHRAAINDGQS